MSIEIKRFTLGFVDTNAYLIGDTDTGQAVLIDPVDDAPLIVREAQAAGWTIALILATHGHFDHVLASAELVELTGAPFYIHRSEARELARLPDRGIQFTRQAFPEAAAPARWLDDEPEVFEVGAIRLESLFTPGHSPGHLAYFMREQNVLFGGDTLFVGAVGRTDLPGGDHAVLMNSIINVMLPLGDSVTLLPGHGPATTLGEQRETNAFIVLELSRP